MANVQIKIFSTILTIREMLITTIETTIHHLEKLKLKSPIIASSIFYRRLPHTHMLLQIN